MFGGKEVSDGAVTRVTTQAIFSEIRIGSDSAGGPVFAQSGALAGISAIDDKQDVRRWNDAWVVPIERACGAIASGTAENHRRDAAAARHACRSSHSRRRPRPNTIVKSGAAAKARKANGAEDLRSQLRPHVPDADARARSRSRMRAAISARGPTT